MLHICCKIHLKNKEEIVWFFNFAHRKIFPRFFCQMSCSGGGGRDINAPLSLLLAYIPNICPIYGIFSWLVRWKKLHQIWKYNVDWFPCSALSKFVLGGSCLSSKLGQKLGNISRKLTFQSFGSAEASAKYPTVDERWQMGAKFFLQKGTSSYCAVLFMQLGAFLKNAFFPVVIQFLPLRIQIFEV